MYSPSSSIRCFILLFWWKHCGWDVRACCIVSLAGLLGASSMLLVVHVKLSNSQSASPLPHSLALPCVPCSPHRDIRRKGSVLPCSGFGSGSVILLPSHPQEHHQTDLLLQSSWESLGSRLPEMSLLWIRLANCSPHSFLNDSLIHFKGDGMG